MSEKKNNFPKTKVKNPEPKIGDPDWIIWAAWADRITFEEIKKKKPRSLHSGNRQISQVESINAKYTVPVVNSK